MSTATPFKTPARILIPKLVRSRDAWKTKANARKDQRKALEIRVRDLEASREHPPTARRTTPNPSPATPASKTSNSNANSIRLAPVAAAVALPTDAPKKSTGPAADTTLPASSTSRSLSCDKPGSPSAAPPPLWPSSPPSVTTGCHRTPHLVLPPCGPGSSDSAMPNSHDP